MSVFKFFGSLVDAVAAQLPATALGRAGAVVGASAVVDFAVQWTVFTVSFLLRTEKLYDLTGTQTFVALAVLNVLRLASAHERQLIVASFVVLWGVRLGWYLVVRVLQVGEDSRFRNVKGRFAVFLLYWTIQGVWVLVSLLPFLLLVASTEQKPIGVLDQIGWAVFAFGYVLEAVADRQKKRFRANPNSKGKWIDEGVWRLSRHPNYLGEVILWFGIFLSTVNGLPAATLPIACIGPVWVFYQLRFLSGVPILERNADKHWGKDAAYNAYKNRVPIFFPRLL